MDVAHVLSPPTEWWLGQKSKPRPAVTPTDDGYQIRGDVKITGVRPRSTIGKRAVPPYGPRGCGVTRDPRRAARTLLGLISRPQWSVGRSRRCRVRGWSEGEPV